MNIISWLFYSFRDYIDFMVNIGTIFGWFFGWFLFSITRAWLRYRRRRKLLKFTPSSEGRVAVSIGVGTNPEGAVRGFLKNNFPDVPLVMSYSKQGYFSGEELLKIFEEIKLYFFDLIRKKIFLRFCYFMAAL